MKTKVSEKGQVTIPRRLRVRLGIRPGHILEMDEQQGRLVVTKAATRDPVDEVFGILKLGRPTDELLAMLRGGRDRA